MAAAAIRSAAGLPLRRAATPASRLSSAGTSSNGANAASSNTTVRTMHSGSASGSGGGQHGQDDFQWMDLCFGTVAGAGMLLFACIMFDGTEPAPGRR